MAKIKNILRYPQDVKITENDYVIGTNADSNKVTKNFKVGDLLDFFETRSNIIGQNNVFVEKQYEGNGGFLFEKVSEAVNSNTAFTVAATELYIVSNAYIVYPSIGTFYFKTDYYLFKRGKGTYGLGQTLTIEEDFFFLRTTEGKSFVQIGNLDPTIETIVYTSLTNPVEAVNTSAETYSIQLNRDTFFIIKSTSQTVPVPNIVYRFVGSAGTYGFGGTLTVEEDFLLIEDQSQTSTTNAINAVSVLFQPLEFLSGTNVQEAIESLYTLVLEGSAENNISRVIYVTDGDLTSYTGTLEEKIAKHINSLNYDKKSTDSDIWVEYTENTGIFSQEFNEIFS